MVEFRAMAMLDEIADGRTDLVFEYLAAGNAANSVDSDGVSLLQKCAYHGDVSAMKFLLANGASLASLGDDLEIIGASFHGHWRLYKFLLENGADVNYSMPDTGETPLHSAICSHRPSSNLVVKVLLSHGANPNAVTRDGVETGGFMRDCRTKRETPLHRAAAFGDEEMIQMLLNAGAKIDARDRNGDTPLGWASWYLRPNSILRKLLYGPFRIHPANRSMEANLLGDPHK